MGRKEIYFSVAALQGTKKFFYEDNFYYDRIRYWDQMLPIKADGFNITNRQFYAVFDGMTKDGGGGTAASIAADTLKKYQDMLLSDLHKDMDKYMIMYLMEVNTKICEAGRNQGGIRMGTSAALFCMEGTMGYAYNVGDSRIYLLRNKKLHLLSEDHTEANRLYELGAIDHSQYKMLNRKRKLTQYLGVPSEEFVIKPYKTSFRMKNGDRILLCTNGITQVLEEDEIKSILQGESRQYAGDILEAVWGKDMKDDCTAVVCEFRKQGLF